MPFGFPPESMFTFTGIPTLGHISAKEVPESPKNLFMGHLSVLSRHRILKLIHDSLSVGSDTGPKLSKRVQNPY
jgi:hypothetical protein